MARPARPLLLLISGLLASVLACNFAIPGGIAPPVGIGAPSDTPPATATNTPEPPTETPSPEPSETPTPTVTLSPTLEPPRGQLTENTNCRTGPLSIYDLISTYLAGKTLDILGRNAEQTYWYVSDPMEPGTQCWLWGRYVQASGALNTVPVFTPPPTPTPSFVWTGTWQVSVDGSMATMDLDQDDSSVTGTLIAEQGYTISGSTSDGGRRLTGQVLEGGQQVVDFQFYMLDNMDQFRGSYEFPNGTASWCGYRNGAGLPSPCQWP